MCWRIKMMYRFLCFTLLSGLVVQCVYSESYVGCLFSPRLCENEEECFDDNAFGLCQIPFSSDFESYRHLLGSETTKLLERELTRLFAGGYRWRHQYTQCVVQNILYANRHRISYDPGLCSRLMQFTLPNVPPEVLSDLESPEPEELAYIKFKPNRDDPESAMFADEIFNPPVHSEAEDEGVEVKGIKKRSFTPFDETGYIRDDWVQNVFDADNQKSKNNEDSGIVDKDALFRKLLETADDTGKLFEQFQTKSDYADRYPDEDTPIVRTDLSSDMNHRAAFTEGGTEWLPVDDDSDYFMENDIIDQQEKKRIREPEDDINNNDISLLGKETYDDGLYSNEDNDNGIELIGDTSNYESIPEDDEDKNFRWNYKHISKDIDDDLTRFSRGNSNGRRKNPEKSGNGNLKDVIQDDYLEDQLYAILPADNGMSTFTRDMRYDTKKPGPTFMIHEDEDGDTSEDDIKMAEQGPLAFITRLSKSTSKDQLLAVLKTPVVAQKSSTVVVPSREVIGGAFVTQN